MRMYFPQHIEDVHMQHIFIFILVILPASTVRNNFDIDVHAYFCSLYVLGSPFYSEIYSIKIPEFGKICIAKGLAHS